MSDESFLNRPRGCGDLALFGCLLPLVAVVLLFVLVALSGAATLHLEAVGDDAITRTRHYISLDLDYASNGERLTVLDGTGIMRRGAKTATIGHASGSWHLSLDTALDFALEGCICDDYDQFVRDFPGGWQNLHILGQIRTNLLTGLTDASVRTDSMDEDPALSDRLYVSGMHLMSLVPRGALAGDADLNGTFDSADMVRVFTAGEYEDGQRHNSYWWEGDWNDDRDFDSADLVAAFQGGSYEQPARGIPEPNGIRLMLVGCLCLVRMIVSQECGLNSRSLGGLD